MRIVVFCRCHFGPRSRRSLHGARAVSGLNHMLVTEVLVQTLHVDGELRAGGGRHSSVISRVGRMQIPTFVSFGLRNHM